MYHSFVPKKIWWNFSIYDSVNERKNCAATAKQICMMENNTRGPDKTLMIAVAPNSYPFMIVRWIGISVSSFSLFIAWSAWKIVSVWTDRRSAIYRSNGRGCTRSMYLYFSCHVSAIDNLRSAIYNNVISATSGRLIIITIQAYKI